MNRFPSVALVPPLLAFAVAQPSRAIVSSTGARVRLSSLGRCGVALVPALRTGPAAGTRIGNGSENDG